MTCQIEIRMVCHIKNGILIAGPLVMNLYFIFICQRVGHTDRGISRISLIAVRAFQCKQNLINARLIFCRPDTVPVKIHAAVQVVRTIIRRQFVFFII